MTTWALETDEARLDVDRVHGRLIGYLDKRTGTQLITEPRLAENWRVLVETDEGAHYVRGRDQPVSDVRPGRDSLSIRWADPLPAVDGRLFELEVCLVVRLSGAELASQLSVRNGSEGRLAEVWGPILGGLTGFGDRHQTKVMAPENAWDYLDHDIFRRFHGSGWHPNPVPEYLLGYPGRLPMAWIDISNTRLRRGFYLGCHDRIPRYKVLRLELQPGIGHGREDPWPRPDELGDETPAGVLVNWTLFPHTPSGEVFEGPPVVAAFHAGDWHEGAALYRTWFDTVAPAPYAHRWMRHAGSFQFTNFMHPEGQVLIRFADVADWAKSAADHGVDAVCMYGWDLGGSEAYDPAYEPDPRLGTWDDLERAIAACHDLGLKVIMLMNLQPVDCLTDWYRDTLHRFRSVDQHGISWPTGYGFGTVAGRINIRRRPQVYASPAYPEYRQIIIDQARRLAEIGADGVHLDKLAWADVKLAFNADLPLSPDQAEWQGILLAVEEMLEACRRVRPDFCLSYEGAWDRLLPFMDANWAWHEPWRLDHDSSQRVTFPEWLPCLAVFQPYDYNVVNNALRLGYQLMVAPQVYTASMAHPPMRKLSQYIREVLRLRRELEDVVYLGEYRPATDIVHKLEDGISIGAHREVDGGRRACVVMNASTGPKRASIAFRDAPNGDVIVYEPFREPQPTSAPVELTLNAERVAVLVAEEAGT